MSLPSHILYFAKGQGEAKIKGPVCRNELQAGLLSFLRGKIACLCIGKAPVKDFRRAKADGIVWLHHVEGVRVAGINVDLRRNARGVQLLEIPHRFRIKRLAFADESRRAGDERSRADARARHRGKGSFGLPYADRDSR